MFLKRYLTVAPVMLVIDWTLGVLNTHDVLPLWTFLVVNFPFGLPHVWLESHWVGTHYAVNGHTVGEPWAFVTLFFAVLAQAGLYGALLGYRRTGRCESRAA